MIGQTQSNVQTPKGRTIIAYITPENTDSMRAYYDNYYALAYPNAIQIETYGGYSSTRRFNCHGFAWHVSEGGSYRWIGMGSPYDNDPEKGYWQDWSYIEVPNEVYPGKVNWSLGDHSAITTNQSGWFISKWNEYPLMKHAWNDSPYGSQGIKYYKLSNPSISCTSGALCYNVTRSCSSNIVDTKFTYDWSVSYPLSEVSGDGTATYIVEGTSQNGMGTVSLTITTPSGATVTASKDVWAGRPFGTVQLLGYDELCPMGDDEDNFLVAYPPDEMSVTDYQWTFPSEWTFTTGQGTDTPEFTIYDDFTDEHVQAYLTNQCGATLYDWIVYQDDDCPDGYYMSFSPNPTTEETTLSIKSASTEKTFGANTEWEVEVYSPSQIIKEKTGRLKGTSTKLQTAGWKDGIYVVRIKYYPKGKSAKVLTGKLVVKR